MNHADQQRNRIPDFASREEEAAFWEAHDITDYLNEFQVVDRREVVVAEILDRHHGAPYSRNAQRSAPNGQGARYRP